MKRDMLTGSHHGARGQVLPLVAFALVALVGLASWAIDVGMWRYEQQLAQSAADSGAIAAAANLQNYSSATLSTMYAAANIDTTANGFAGSSTNGVLNAANNVTVTVSNPPSTGSATADSNAVQVVVSKVLPVYFGWKSATVSASAVATKATSSNCLVETGTQYDVVTMDSGSTLSMPSCGMASDGWLQMNGSVTIDAPSITYLSGKTGSGTFPKASPTLASGPTSDPCTTITGCKYLQNNPPSSTCNTGSIYNNSPTGGENLTPGTYCFTTFAAGTYNFAAGVYNFKYGFSENGAVTLQGTGVTIYSPTSLTFGSSVTLNLTAPTSGSTAGVVLYLAGNSGLQFNADTNPMTLNGVIYVPGDGSSSSGSVQFDALTMTVGAVVSTSLTLNSNASLTFTGVGISSGGDGGLSE